MRLNIGGEVYKIVKRDLLTKIPGSLLEQTFNGDQKLDQIDGSVFVDRDPEPFSNVLTILRNDFKFWP